MTWFCSSSSALLLMSKRKYKTRFLDIHVASAAQRILLNIFVKDKRKRYKIEKFA